ncbi:MAG: efflux RND transporter periplasmic adaptor subunit [Bryobacteraceae bacterium]|nr:efflux RND transporter periplasmic adaptor subunit [Bryobacteraceae bacterium]
MLRIIRQSLQYSGKEMSVIAAKALIVATVACSISGCAHVEPVRANARLPESQPVPRQAGKREIRATGTIKAVRAFTVQVPQIAGGLNPQTNGRLTLVKLVLNGTKVNQGDVLAEFDRTAQIDAAREAKAKYEDLSHQVKEKEAKNGSDAAKRSNDLKQAEADLAKAEIQLKKGPVLSEISRLQNEEKGRNARARVESLVKSDASRRLAEVAALEILKLQMERQKVALDRAQLNAEKLILKAPLAGMVALENLWRGGSMGNAQEGDQLWNGQPLLKIFDPTTMEVATQIGEPDGVVLHEGTTATVYLDAYPDAVFRARFQSASPVATSALGSPIKNFSARFIVEATDPRLLPDLSAAVIVHGDPR